MATYDNLPVYKESYDLLLELFRCSKEFSREYKYTLGESIKTEVTQLIMAIYRANSTKHERVAHITQAREHVEVVRLLLRLLHDLKQVNLKKFVFLNMKVESVSKQLVGWYKHCVH